MAARRRDFPYIPTLSSPRPYSLPISAAGETDQIDESGERTGRAETDLPSPSLLKSQWFAESTASGLILHALNVHNQTFMWERTRPPWGWPLAAVVPEPSWIGQFNSEVLYLKAVLQPGLHQ